MPRRRGRPPVDPTDTSKSVSVKVPSKEYDELYRRAHRAGVSVPEIVRRDLRLWRSVKGQTNKSEG